MKIIYKDQSENPKLGEVKINQQFLDLNGCLCIKHDNTCYIRLTDDEGVPSIVIFEEETIHTSISKILPEIERYVIPQ